MRRAGLVAVAVLSVGEQTVFRGLGVVAEHLATLAAPPRDGELVGVLAVFPEHLRKESSPGVYKPVAHLCREEQIMMHQNANS